MDDQKQENQDPKIKIEDLAEAEKAASATAGDATGGAGALNQSFNPGSVGGPLKEEKVGLVWK